MKTPLHGWSATGLVHALARRELTAGKLARALCERSAAFEPRLQAWAWFDADAAVRRAAAIDRGGVTGTLYGLPLGVKDNIDTAGIPTAYGSSIYAGHLPAADAACVALARLAGAWVLGKTRCTEFANMTPCATRNPHAAGHTPGGSSSGSAAAVAAGLVPLALGTQTAGSVIRPAAYCGVVGYKPSPRRLLRAGVKANADSLDEVGVLARSVDDAALLVQALGGIETMPPGASGPRPGDHGRPPRIGVTLTSRAASLHPAMAQMVESAGGRLAAAGARVKPARWPAALDDLFDAQRSVQLFETLRALGPELHYRRDRLSAQLLALLDEAAAMPPAMYAAALRTAASAAARIDDLFGDAEVLVTPAAPGAAPPSLDQTGDPLFNRPWQLLGCPCIGLPGGVDDAGLPLGLQLVARPGDDQQLFAAAAWVYDSLQAAIITQSLCRN